MGYKYIFMYENVFYNNNVFSYSSKGYGGSFYLYNSNSRTALLAATLLHNMVVFFSLGSDFSFIECTFQNNTVNGDLSEKGGAIFSTESILYLNKNSFIDNILSSKDENTIVYYVEGAACCFSSYKVQVSDRDFVKNRGVEKSKF